jgi:predicted cobalt transporter CbtA
MSAELSTVKAGLAIVLLGLFFNVALGIAFGVNEDAFKDYIAEGIAAHPEVHDEKSEDKIWRYAQRTHFHAGGIAAFCLGLIILVMFSDLRPRLRRVSSILIGLGSFYPLAWLSMFFLAPSIGRDPAHVGSCSVVFFCSQIYFWACLKIG